MTKHEALEAKMAAFTQWLAAQRQETFMRAPILKRAALQRSGSVTARRMNDNDFFKGPTLSEQAE